MARETKLIPYKISFDKLNRDQRSTVLSAFEHNLRAGIINPNCHQRLYIQRNNIRDFILGGTVAWLPGSASHARLE